MRTAGFFTPSPVRRHILSVAANDRKGNPVKAFERLAILNEADEKPLFLIPALHDHKLKGTSKYSIDADTRKSPWRITFQWENAEMKNVELVRIEDPH